MDVCSPLIADSQAFEVPEPGEGSFNNPSVLAQLVIGFDAPASNSREYSPLAAGFPATAKVVGLISVQLQRPAPWSATTLANAWDCIQDLLERDGVMLVGWPHQNSQRDAIGIGDQVVLCPTLGSVCGIRADRFAPLFARMVEASTAARSQSILP